MRTSPLVQTVFWMAAARECVCAQQPLTIAVYNYAGVSDSVMAQALTTARMAFRSAGIQTEWISCRASKGWPEDCLLPENSRYLEVMVMHDRVAPPPGKHLYHEVAGYALTDTELPHPRAYVFYSPTENVALATVRPVGDALGCVLAHEAAHLLGLTHEAHGVMRGNLDREGIDDTSSGRAFSLQDKARLRAGIVRNTAAGAALMAATRP